MRFQGGWGRLARRNGFRQRTQRRKFHAMHYKGRNVLGWPFTGPTHASYPETQRYSDYLRIEKAFL